MDRAFVSADHEVMVPEHVVVVQDQEGMLLPLSLFRARAPWISRRSRT
jgi:hypothetical protein